MFYMRREDAEQAVDKANANITATFLQVHTFLESLSLDDLGALRWLLHNAAHGEGYFHHLMGLIEGIERYKHDKCICSPEPHKVSDHDDPNWMLQQAFKNHDYSEQGAPLISDEMVVHHPDGSSHKVNDPCEHCDPPPLDSPQTELPTGLQIAGEMMVSATDHRGMEITLPLIHAFDVYNVTPVAPDKDGVVCASCGLEYVSLEDRMLKKPGVEGCEGCIQAAKWGGGKTPGDD